MAYKISENIRNINKNIYKSMKDKAVSLQSLIFSQEKQSWINENIGSLSTHKTTMAKRRENKMCQYRWSKSSINCHNKLSLTIHGFVVVPRLLTSTPKIFYLLKGFYFSSKFAGVREFCGMFKEILSVACLQNIVCLNQFVYKELKLRHFSRSFPLILQLWF